jgi:hypothetical protein
MFLDMHRERSSRPKPPGDGSGSAAGAVNRRGRGPVRAGPYVQTGGRTRHRHPSPSAGTFWRFLPATGHRGLRLFFSASPRPPRNVPSRVKPTILSTGTLPTRRGATAAGPFKARVDTGWCVRVRTRAAAGMLHIGGEFSPKLVFTRLGRRRRRRRWRMLIVSNRAPLPRTHHAPSRRSPPDSHTPSPTRRVCLRTPHSAPRASPPRAPCT